MFVYAGVTVKTFIYECVYIDMCGYTFVYIVV